jgi:hypothetical protein
MGDSVQRPQPDLMRLYDEVHVSGRLAAEKPELTQRCCIDDEVDRVRLLSIKVDRQRTRQHHGDRPDHVEEYRMALLDPARSPARSHTFACIQPRTAAIAGVVIPTL